jgi:hypothetical protein
MWYTGTGSTIPGHGTQGGEQDVEHAGNCSVWPCLMQAAAETAEWVTGSLRRMATRQHGSLRRMATRQHVRLAYQPAVLFSQNKLATSNQPAVLFSQNKTAPAISASQTNRLLVTCYLRPK